DTAANFCKGFVETSSLLIGVFLSVEASGDTSATGNSVLGALSFEFVFEEEDGACLTGGNGTIKTVFWLKDELCLFEKSGRRGGKGGKSSWRLSLLSERDFASFKLMAGAN
ncbi:MAG: hypothetical protein VW521_04490, partial [Rhodospirillales bacterium]